MHRFKRVQLIPIAALRLRMRTTWADVDVDGAAAWSIRQHRAVRAIQSIAKYGVHSTLVVAEPLSVQWAATLGHRFRVGCGVIDPLPAVCRIALPCTPLCRSVAHKVIRLAANDFPVLGYHCAHVVRATKLVIVDARDLGEQHWRVGWGHCWR